MEDNIGKPLFVVIGKRLEPTPVALQLYPRAKHIAKQTEDFERVALANYFMDLVEITVFYETLVPVAYLSDVRARIAKTFPELKMKLLHRNRKESMEALENGDAHFAILATQGELYPSSAVGVTYLGTAKFSPYAHPSSSLFNKDEVSLLDLSEQVQYISENIDTVNLNVMKQSSRHHIVSNTDLIVSMLESGGWSALSNLDAKKYLEAGWIKEVKTKEIAQPYSVNIAMFTSYTFHDNNTAIEVGQIIQKSARDFLK
ncbi:transcriptional regulators [Vibrio ishigakensis]|uniref:Transcriptional regulators n=1 Tax=Vibrio ishigakensis TaxID=1481914 RepID=A0A0B8Q6V2_9VIBR|nr:transcriptional regulators [Vibrio ishigakensis]